MACSERVCGKIFLYLGLFVVVGSFCHCASLTKLKPPDKCKGQPKGSVLCHGTLLIGQSSLQGAKPKRTEAPEDLLDADIGYQADMGWGKRTQSIVWGDDFLKLNTDSTAVEQLLQLEPEVECTADAMHLQVRNGSFTPGSLFFVDRGGPLSPLPLSKLLPSCGYTIRPTQRHLVFVVSYDACFVALEEDRYVLPLRWFGLAVRMSCPIMAQSLPSPPMVSCHTKGMVVKTDWVLSVATINVKLNGSWEPLMKASSSCGFSVVVHPEGVVISVHYAPCLQEKDGLYTLELTGDGEIKISCPSLSQSQPEPTKSPHLKPEDYQTSKSHLSAVPQVPGINLGKPQPREVQEIIPKPPLPYHYLYPDFSYSHLANPDTKPTTTVQPTPTTSPVVKTTTGQTRKPYYPFPFYVHLPQPLTLPTQPPLIELPVKQPAGQQNPSYPLAFYSQPAALVKLLPPKPPFSNKPHRNVNGLFYQDSFYNGFSPYRYPTFTSSPQSQAPLQPEAPQAYPAYKEPRQQVTTSSSNRNTTDPVIQQPASSGGVPPNVARSPPVPCSQGCPSGFSSCCRQRGFHQTLHIVPPGFGRSLGSARPHQKPAQTLTMQARTASNSAPISLQFREPGEKLVHFQPPDGARAARLRSDPSKFTNLELPPVYLYDSLYPIQQKKLPHLLQSQLQHPYNVLLRPQSTGNDPFNQMEPYNMQTPRKPQNQQQQQSKPTDSQARDSPKCDLFHVPVYALQEAQAPTSLVPNENAHKLGH